MMGTTNGNGRTYSATMRDPITQDVAIRVTVLGDALPDKSSTLTWSVLAFLFGLRAPDLQIAFNQGLNAYEPFSVGVRDKGTPVAVAAVSAYEFPNNAGFQLRTANGTDGTI